MVVSSILLATTAFGTYGGAPIEVARQFEQLTHRPVAILVDPDEKYRKTEIKSTNFEDAARIAANRCRFAEVSKKIQPLGLHHPWWPFGVYYTDNWYFTYSRGAKSDSSVKWERKQELWSVTSKGSGIFSLSELSTTLLSDYRINWNSFYDGMRFALAANLASREDILLAITEASGAQLLINGKEPLKAFKLKTNDKIELAFNVREMRKRAVAGCDHLYVEFDTDSATRPGAAANALLQRAIFQTAKDSSIIYTYCDPSKGFGKPYSVNEMIREAAIKRLPGLIESCTSTPEHEVINSPAGSLRAVDLQAPISIEIHANGVVCAYYKKHDGSYIVM